MCFGLNMPILALIAAVFVSIFISGEFHFGTMKNYISKGFNRDRIFLAKLATCASAVSILYAVFVPVILIAGTIFLGFDPHGVFDPAQFAGTVVVSWLLFMAYVAVFTVVSFNIQSSGAAIAVNICLVSIFPTILHALDFVFGKTGFKISSLWLPHFLSDVTSYPIQFGAVPAGIAAAVIYLLLSYFGGTYLFRKQDIK